jgi:hypothetical protein
MFVKGKYHYDTERSFHLLFWTDVPARSRNWPGKYFHSRHHSTSLQLPTVGLGFRLPRSCDISNVLLHILTIKILVRY